MNEKFSLVKTYMTQPTNMEKIKHSNSKFEEEN
jgi:hypothetical protein